MCAPSQRARTSTAPSAEAAATRRARPGGSSRAAAGGSASAARASASSNRCEAGAERLPRPRSRPSAAASAGLRRATSTTLGSFSTQPGGRSRERASSSRQAATARSAESCRPLSRPRRATLRYARCGSGSIVAAGAVAARDLVLGPRTPAHVLELLDERVGEREEIAHVVGRVRDLRLGQRPPRPVAERLVVRERDAERALDQPVVRHRDAVPDEAGRELRVEDVRRAHAVARREQQQVARRRVHHELHRGVAHELGDRADVDVLERIEHGEPLGRRELQQARDGAVRPLPHELGVEREPALAASVGRERRQRRPDPADARSQWSLSAFYQTRAREPPRDRTRVRGETRIPRGGKHHLG